MLCVYVFGVQFCQAQPPVTLSHNGPREACEESLQPVRHPVGDQEGSAWRSHSKPGDPEGWRPFKAKAEAKARALSSDALAEALAKGQRREAEMVAAQKAKEEEADEAWRNWARRQDLSPVGAPPSK